MGDAVLSGLVFVVSLALSIAYARRVRHMPLSQRHLDRRAWSLSLAFLVIACLWAMYTLVQDINAKAHWWPS